MLPGRYPEIAVIENTLERLQEEVGGLIETVYPGCDDPVDIICNEEGKLTGLEANRVLTDEEGDIYDVIAGNFLVAMYDDEGNFTSLTDEYAEKYRARFMSPETIWAMNGKIHVIREAECDVENDA